MSITRGFLKHFAIGSEPVVENSDQEVFTRFPAAQASAAEPAPTEGPVTPRRVTPTHSSFSRFANVHQREATVSLRERPRHHSDPAAETAELRPIARLISLTNEPSDDISVDVLRAALPNRFDVATLRQSPVAQDDFDYG